MACDISERLGGFIKRLVDVSQRFGQMESQEDVVVAAETFLTKLDKLISMLELLPDTSDDPPPPAKRQKKTATITKTATAATITKATATSTPTRPRRQSAGRRKIQKQSEEIEISSGLHEVEDDSDVLVKTEPSSSSFLDEPVGEIANEDYKVVKADIMEEGDDREDHDDGDDGDYGNDGDDGDYGDDGDDANDANDGDDNNDNLEDDAVEDEHPSDVKDTKGKDKQDMDRKVLRKGKQEADNVSADSLETSDEHSTTRSASQFECQFCPNIYTRRNNLNRHVNAYHYNIVHRCSYSGCNKKFTRADLLQLHINEDHECIFRYICSTCDWGTNKKFSFDSHVSKHSQTKLYSCDLCNRRFSHVNSYHFHKNKRLCEMTQATKKHKCPVCQKLFALDKYLKGHMVQHEEPKFQCNHCGNRYKHKSSLTKHGLTHKVL